MHEIAWSRALGRAAGNTTWGTGLALALFMLGSGAGAWLVRRVARAWAHPGRSVAIIEAVIGVGGGAVTFVCFAAPPASAVFGIAGAAGTVVDVTASVGLGLAPALGLGMTVPLLVHAMGEGATDGGVRRVYVAGLVGAIGGTLGAATALVPWSGYVTTGLAAGGLNLAVALVALVALPRDASALVASQLTLRSLPSGTATFCAASVLGLGAQTVWARTLPPYSGVSVVSFALIVAVYLAAQSLGFALQRAVEDRAARVTPRLGLSLGSVALLALTALSTAREPGGRDAGALAWLLHGTAVVSVAVLPVAILLGVIQSSVLQRVERERDRGATTAVLLALGSAAGALASAVTAFVLLPSFGPRGALAALALPLLLASFCELRASRTRAAIGITAASALALAGLVVYGPGPARFLGPAYDDEPVLYSAHGVQDTIAITEVDLPNERGVRHLVANGVSYSGDSGFAERYMRLLAHLPALAATRRDRALLICVGTGITLDALRTEGFERIDAVDISPDVVATLRFFRRANHHVSTDPRVRWITDDGARYVRTTRERYDVITLEPPPPRAPGATSLYTREFYEAAAARLTDGGAVAQWLPLHGMTGTEAAAIAATFLGAFPDAALHIVERNEAILLSRGGAMNVAASPDAVSDLARIGVPADAITDTTTLGPDALRRIVRDAPILSDARPAPELLPFGPAPTASLDAWLEQVARASPAGDPRSGAMFGRLAASFVRVREGIGADADRTRVRDELTAWRERSPDDPYVAYVFEGGRLPPRE
ncbi:MAG: fused MFS/spermidine synthase [Sandaracinaceae bacterium]